MKKRNIQFLPKKIKYNALKKFRGDIIKIPSYVIDEVFKTKSTIEISFRDKEVAKYSYDNLFHFITKNEEREYDGKFRNQDIKYTLTHVKI